MKNNYLKRIFCALAVILAVILTKNLIKNWHNIERRIDYLHSNEMYNKLVNMKLLKKCYYAYEINEYFSQEGLDFEAENKKLINNSLKKLYDRSITTSTDALKIPTITHSIYFTSSQKPIQLNDFYIFVKQESFIKLNSTGHHWEHNFWTDNPEIIPPEIKAIKGVKVRNINEFSDHFLYQSLINLLQKGNTLKGYFASASDLLRYMAIEKFGGIYFDLDYEIYHPNVLINYFQRFDFLGARDDNGYLANGFMAAKAHHPILKKALELEARNQGLEGKAKIPDSIKYPCEEYQKIFYSGPPLLTTAYFLAANTENNNDIALPNWVSLNFDLSRYKNKYCQYAKITKEDLIKNNENLEELIRDFTKNFKQEDSLSNHNKNRKFKDFEQNIYFDLKHRNDVEIIGADMGCGNWSSNSRGFERIYYWNWPF